jgi:hypothetical protein
MAARILHRTFRSYSGPVVYGTKDEEFPGDERSHVDRACWLTEGVETGHRVGSCFAADGTCHTIGRGQHIIVYPRELANEDWNAKDDQGGAGKLLRDIEINAVDLDEPGHVPNQNVEALWAAFKAEGWYLAQDGTFRWIEDGQAKVKGRWMDHKAGDLVHGAVLRDAITPIGGKVPKTGSRWETARRWAALFHAVMSDPDFAHCQWRFERHHLIDRVRTRKIQTNPRRRRQTLQQALYGSVLVENVVVNRDISPDLDLALCVLHSHSVNAPAIAYRKLVESLKATGYKPATDVSQVVFARDLLRRLARAKYGRWNEDIENGRWQRTRKRAMETGWWPLEFFRSPGGLMMVDM